VGEGTWPSSWLLGLFEVVRAHREFRSGTKVETVLSVPLECRHETTKQVSLSLL
jgi:hypothetical protein